MIYPSPERLLLPFTDKQPLLAHRHCCAIGIYLLQSKGKLALCQCSSWINDLVNEGIRNPRSIEGRVA
jgi:phage gp36-like protein